MTAQPRHPAARSCQASTGGSQAKPWPHPVVATPLVAEDELLAVGQRHDQVRTDALNEHWT